MLFKILLTIFAATVAGLPHVGMLDTPTVSDVGLIFDERDYSKLSVVDDVNEGFSANI